MSCSIGVRITRCIVATLFVFVCVTVPSFGQLLKGQVDELDGVSIDEKLEAIVPGELRFRNSSDKQVRLGDYFDGQRPVLLSLNYSDCPMLCKLQLNGLVDGLRNMKLEPGRDFEIVSVSIDPLETPQRARQSKANYVRAYGRPQTADGWHFLCGDKQSIAALADAVGFRFKYLPKQKEYAHAAVTIVVTPKGKVSRYLYGVLYPAQTLKFALIEAGEGKVGSTLERALLYCFHYDAASGRYAPVARRLMSIGAAATVTALVFGLVPVWLKRRGRLQRETLAQVEVSHA